MVVLPLRLFEATHVPLNKRGSHRRREMANACCEPDCRAVQSERPKTSWRGRLASSEKAAEGKVRSDPEQKREPEKGETLSKR